MHTISVPNDVARRRARLRPAGWSVAIAIAAGLATAACSDAAGPNRFELEIAASRWEQRGPAAYTFVFDQLCECLYTQSVRLTVRDGDVVAAEALPGSSPPFGPLDPESFPTIDELFDRLRAAADADPVRFEVSFDADLGYPTSASVDISEQVADEEYSFTVRSLVAEET